MASRGYGRRVVDERERDHDVLGCGHLYEGTPLKRTCNAARELEPAWPTPCLRVPDAEPSHRVCRSQRYHSDSGPPKGCSLCHGWATCPPGCRGGSIDIGDEELAYDAQRLQLGGEERTGHLEWRLGAVVSRSIYDHLDHKL